MILYHYTKLENLPLIVQEDKLEFIMTDYMHFDDRSEGRYAFDVPRRVYKKWYYDVGKRFVLSLCREKDNLPMLKEYANNASGLVLGINTDYIAVGDLYECKYDPSEIWMIEENMKAIKNHYNAIDPLNQQSTDITIRNLEKSLIQEEQNKLLAFKNPHYKYEKEWRVLKKVQRGNINFRFKNGKLIHFSYYHLDRNSLESIYVGPNNSKSILGEIKKYLQHIKLINIEPQMLQVPYKSY